MKRIIAFLLTLISFLFLVTASAEASLIRSELYATVSPIVYGMKILEEEGVHLEKLSAHGGLFKTKGVMSRYLSAALDSQLSSNRVFIIYKDYSEKSWRY